jgi:hypothetical protein
MRTIRQKEIHLNSGLFKINSIRNDEFSINKVEPTCELCNGYNTFPGRPYTAFHAWHERVRLH